MCSREESEPATCLLDGVSTAGVKKWAPVEDGSVQKRGQKERWVYFKSYCLKGEQ